MKTYPLLQSQLDIFLTWISDSSNTQYNLPILIQLSKNVSTERLIMALLKLLECHPTMKTRFVLEEGVPKQYVDEAMDISIQVKQMTEAEAEEYLKYIVRPFDLLSGEPLVRFEILETEFCKYFYMEVSHCISDGLSLSPILTKNISTLYSQGSVQPETYGIMQYAEEEVNSFTSDSYKIAKEYYRNLFADTTLLTLAPSVENTKGRAIRYSSYIPVNEVDKWCADHETQPNCLFQAAFTYVMAEYSYEDKVAYSSINHGRMDKRLMNTFGMYVKSTPVLVEIDRKQPIVDFIKSFRRQFVSSVRYGCYPFNHFCRDLQQKQGVSFGFQGANMIELVTLDDQHFLATQINRTTTSSDLNIVIYLRDDQYDVRIEASEAMYEENFIKQVAESVKQCVLNMMNHVDEELGKISILSTEEQQRISQLSEGEKMTCNEQETFVDLFLKVAHTDPNRLAVVDIAGNYTYESLDSTSNLVAQALNDLGVRKGDFIAVMLPRRKEFLAAVLGVMKIGAAYVPVDPCYPVERRQQMVEDCGAKLVITGELISDWLQKYIGCSIKAYNATSPNGLAYMIYTSGSTGKPKGVMLPHRALRAFIAWRLKTIGITAESRHAAHASFSFDASLDDLLCPLAAGGSVYILDEDIRNDMDAMAQYFKVNRITGLTLSTSLGMSMLNQYSDLPLQFLMMGGEKMLPCPKTNVRIINGYGPTEFTVCSSFHIVDQNKDVNIPIGRPVPNSWSFICDKSGNLLPQNAVGELCLTGPQIALGYWHREELTAEKFVDCPLDSIHYKMYRTGDLARYNVAGELEFLGRIDNQVKLHGFRIEMGEIENTASGYPGIKSVVAEVRNVNDLQNLCLYYVANEKIENEKLRSFMAATLPEYMVPSAFIQLTEMPLTPNGKVNRKALPEPEIRQEEIIVPANELEQQLFDLTSQMLKTDQFGVTTNLLTLGLSSLASMRLSAIIQSSLSRSLPSKEILQYPTLRQMAEYLTSHSDERLNRYQSYPLQAYYPLSENQRGVYIDWEMHRDATQYNMPGVENLGKVDVEELCGALEKIVHAHPILKTHLAQMDGDVVQLRNDDAGVSITCHTLTEEPTTEFFQSRMLPFNLFEDNLYRLEVYVTPQQVYLFHDFHHIVFDGASAMIFMNELNTLLHGGFVTKESYTAFDMVLDEQVLFASQSYKDAEAYFANLVQDADTGVYPHSGNFVDERAYATSIACVSRHDIDNFCRSNKLTANSFFLTSMMQVIHRISREESLLLATISSGRAQMEVRNDVGMFVKTLPVSSTTTAQQMRSMTFVQAVDRMQKQILTTISYDFFPYTHLVEGHQIHPEIMLVYQGGDDEFESSIGVSEDTVVFRQDASKFPILLTVYPKGKDEYLLYFEYDRRLYTPDSIEQLSSVLCTYMKNAISGGLLCNISMLDRKEEQAVMDIAEGKRLEVNVMETFVQLFVDQSHRSPGALAVADKDSHYLYAELDAKSDTLAHLLIERGIEPNTFVCVMLDRTKEFPLAVIAIHKVGAAYTPLDLEYPNERLSYMVENSESKVIITTHEILTKKMAEGGLDLRQVEIIYLDDVDLCKKTASINLTTPDNLAYMIYTSGSTGLPKGVMLHQKGLRSYIASMIDVLELTDKDRISNHRPFSFDAHIQDLYPVLTIGGSIHIMPSEIRRDMKGLHDFIVEHKITGGSYTTSLAAMLLDSHQLPLRYITATGEKMIGLVSGDVQIYNGYGPTECTDLISVYKLEKGHVYEDIPIGRPMANSYCFIVDQCGNLLPIGAAGELCFASIQVGRGYWKLPDKTTEVFGDCPYLPLTLEGKPWQMYHTGDLCRWNAEHQIEYLGRIDSQVKLRGFRIELGEIETQATKMIAIQQAVAVVREVVGTQHLILYYLVKEGVSVSENEVRHFLESTKLPEYMIPELYMQLDQLPFNSSGKVNRKALPMPEIKVEDIVAPETELEQQLFEITAEILKHRQFGVTTNLIAVGMNSLSAMRLSAVIFQKVSISVPTKEIMSDPTLRQLAVYISSNGRDERHAVIHPQREYYPISENQRGVFIDWDINRKTTQYNIPGVRKLTDTTPEALMQALTSVIDSHPYMKTGFAVQDLDIVQVRKDDDSVQIDVYNLDIEPNSDFFQSRIRPFNLLEDRLYRFEIYQTPGCIYLFQDVHHIIFDGSSSLIFLNDVQKVLGGEVLTKETYTAFDRALDEQDLLASAQCASAEQWFDSLLSDVESVLYPKSVTPQCTRNAAQGISVTCKREDIDKLCRENGLTQSNYFLAAFMQTLHRLTREERLLITTINNGRSVPEMIHIIGMFVKTMPVTSVYNYEELKTLSFSEVVKRTQKQVQETFSFDFYPLTRMVERNNIRPNIIFEYQGGILDDFSVTNAEDQPMLRLDTAKVPMEVSVFPTSDGEYRINIVYDGSLYSQTDMNTVAYAIKQMAEQAAITNNIANLPLISEDESKELVALSAGSTIQLDFSKTYMDYFLESAAKHSDLLAVADGSSEITYAQLNRWSDLIAHKLISLGIKKHDFVGVMIERSKEFPVCVFGIHKAGAAYLPLDIEYPNERLLYMLEDSETRVLITTHGVLEEKRKDGAFDADIIIYLDEIDWEKESEEVTPINLCTPDCYTYIIYTSGSTGKPKGVVLHHKGLFNYIFSTIDELKLTAADRISAHRSFSFDSHIEELYAILLLGGSLHIMPEEIRKDLQAIYNFVVEHKITGGGYTTSIATMLCNTYDMPVRYLSAIGEKLVGVVSRNTQIINAYGPTECTDHISIYYLKKDKEYKDIPIGHVIANSWCFIVDSAGQLAPKGCCGELCIAGIQVGIGYWHLPELTSKVFVDCPFVDCNVDGTPVRMYHTGDLARYNEDGDLECLGRIDNQVKLRGYRIELGEIETEAMKVEGIQQAVAMICDINGDKHLVLYYTVNEGDILTNETIDANLKASQLASYMVPEVYVFMPEMPRTPNGKINRRALPMPTMQAEEIVVPETETEKQLFELTVELLKHNRFGVTSNLISLGLSSLNAMRLSAIINQRLNYEVRVSDLLGNPTIHKIASMIDSGEIKSIRKSDMFMKRKSSSEKPDINDIANVITVEKESQSIVPKTKKGGNNPLLKR